jgi:hypothetical protein
MRVERKNKTVASKLFASVFAFRWEVELSTRNSHLSTELLASLRAGLPTVDFPFLLRLVHAVFPGSSENLCGA